MVLVGEAYKDIWVTEWLWYMV